MWWCMKSWRKAAMHSFGSLSLWFNYPYANCDFESRGRNTIIWHSSRTSQLETFFAAIRVPLGAASSYCALMNASCCSSFRIAWEIVPRKDNSKCLLWICQKRNVRPERENVWNLLYGFKHVSGGGSRRIFLGMEHLSCRFYNSVLEWLFLYDLAPWSAMSECSEIAIDDEVCSSVSESTSRRSINAPLPRFMRIELDLQYCYHNW